MRNGSALRALFMLTYTYNVIIVKTEESELTG